MSLSASIANAVPFAPLEAVIAFSLSLLVGGILLSLYFIFFSRDDAVEVNKDLQLGTAVENSTGFGCSRPLAEDAGAYRVNCWSERTANQEEHLPLVMDSVDIDSRSSEVPAQTRKVSDTSHDSSEELAETTAEKEASTLIETANKGESDTRDAVSALTMTSEAPSRAPGEELSPCEEAEDSEDFSEDLEITSKLSLPQPRSKSSSDSNSIGDGFESDEVDEEFVSTAVVQPTRLGKTEIRLPDDWEEEFEEQEETQTTSRARGSSGLGLIRPLGGAALSSMIQTSEQEQMRLNPDTLTWERFVLDTATNTWKRSGNLNVADGAESDNSDVWGSDGGEAESPTDRRLSAFDLTQKQQNAMAEAEQKHAESWSLYAETGEAGTATGILKQRYGILQDGEDEHHTNSMQLEKANTRIEARTNEGLAKDEGRQSTPFIHFRYKDFHLTDSDDSDLDLVLARVQQRVQKQKHLGTHATNITTPAEKSARRMVDSMFARGDKKRPWFTCSKCQNRTRDLAEELDDGSQICGTCCKRRQ